MKSENPQIINIVDASLALALRRATLINNKSAQLLADAEQLRDDMKVLELELTEIEGT